MKTMVQYHTNCITIRRKNELTLLHAKNQDIITFKQQMLIMKEELELSHFL